VNPPHRGFTPGSYSKTKRSIRKWCKTCDGHLLTEHPLWQLVDVYAAVLPELLFEAMVHVNYGETVLHIPERPSQAAGPAEGDGRLGRDGGRVARPALHAGYCPPASGGGGKLQVPVSIIAALRPWQVSPGTPQVPALPTPQQG
jgi:hypothetical protein